MKIIILGDSHTAQLQRGVEALQAENAPALRGQQWIVRPLGGGHLLPFPFFKAHADHIAITQPEYRRTSFACPSKCTRVRNGTGSAARCTPPGCFATQIGPGTRCPAWMALESRSAPASSAAWWTTTSVT
jgi:hypothetical protein